MIQLKNSAQISAMIEAGRITGEALLLAREHVREGVSTYELDKLIREHIERSGAKPSFLGYAGFPGSACISINDEVIHGIPSKKKILCDGDIVKIDVGAYYKGFHGDAARTIAVGKVSDEAKRLIEVTRNSFFAGVEQLKVGNRIGDIGSAIQSCVEKAGFSVVRRYIGHGVGRELHEQPDVPNYGTAGRGTRLCAGMTLAIEPMITMGSSEIFIGDDGWTVYTADGKPSCHIEHTVLVTEGEPEILTLPTKFEG
jgi:methionyl aminopeptidase